MKFYRKITKNYKILSRNYEESWNFIKKWWKIMKFYRKIIKNHEILSKNHQKSWNFIAKLCNPTCRVYIDSRCVFEEQLWNLIEQSTKQNRSFLDDLGVSLLRKQFYFFDSWTYHFSVLGVSFAKKSSKNWRFFSPTLACLLACCLLAAGWLAGYGVYSFNS